MQVPRELIQSKMMKFDLNHSISILERTPAVIRHLLEGQAEEWTQANEGDRTWSAFDVVGHLVHGEKTDWMPRLHIILSDAENKTFEPYDRFAQFEMSKGKSLDTILDEFGLLRKENLNTLREKELTASQLSKKGIHPELGEVSLREMLAAWVAHDLGHIAQITRVMAKQYKTEVGPWTKYLTILNHTPKE